MEGSVQVAESKSAQDEQLKSGSELPRGEPALKKARDDDTIRCFVDSGVLATFPTSTSKQRQEDVLYSLLFAQLAADGEYNRQVVPPQLVQLF